MTKKIFALLILLLVSIPNIVSLPNYAFAQVDTTWVRRYNGPGNGYDYASAIALDGSGNVYVTGSSPADYATIKYYGNGDTAWVRRYNGPGNGADQAYAIALDGSGNVYVTGLSYGSSGTNYDYATVKYDPQGNQLWVRRYNGPGNNRDEAHVIALDGSGNVYVTGYSYSAGSMTSSDYATIKYYPNGDTAWVRRYNGPGNNRDGASAIALDGSNNVYVTGSSYDSSGTSSDYATIKYYANGDTAWVRQYNYGAGDNASAIALDGSGNVYVTGGSYYAWTNYDYATVKYDSNGTQLWVQRYNGVNSQDGAGAIALDGSGNVYVTGSSYGSVTSRDYATIKYDSSGTELWVRRYNGPGNYEDVALDIALDGCGNVYVTGSSTGSGTDYDYATVRYDPQGTQLWVQRYNGPGNSSDYAHDMALDGSNNVYITGGSYGSGTSSDYATIKYEQKTLVLREGPTQFGPIRNQTFSIYRVTNNPPTMSEEYKGDLTTDANGRITLPPGWFDVGDSVKVERLLFTQPAVKHTGILPNMYSIKIDNGKFNTTTGVISYHTLTLAPQQDVIVDHTTVMFDLLVSVEWDADQQYLDSLLAGFRLMSNYWYDVSDGQLYLNKVKIYDYKMNWNQADVWIYASNMEWPSANVYYGIAPLMGGISGPLVNTRLYFPRIFYHDIGNRNLTYTGYPYSWTIDTTTYGGRINVYPPSRVLAHEFGHYGIGFWDEYMDSSWQDIFPGPGTPEVYDFGLMDDQLRENVAQNSEMSCATIQYSNPSYRRTFQWTGRGNRSCWDYFRWNFEGRYGGIFAPIKRPTAQMFSGPNDNMTNLNYDVGRLIPSTGAITNYNSGARTVGVIVRRLTNNQPIPNMQVTLWKTSLYIYIPQGNTADPPDTGRILCLGFRNDDVIIAQGRVYTTSKVAESWLFGEGVLGESGESKFKNTYRTSPDGDSLDLFLWAVTGDYPLIYATSLSTGTPKYILTASHMFSSNPTVGLHPDDGTPHSYTLEPTPTGYSVMIPDDIGSSGTFTLLALDDSVYTFFVNTPYRLAEIVDTAFGGVITGPEGGCELLLDILNSNLDKVLILASSYPTIRTGLDPQSEQGGEVYSLSSYPSVALLGSNSLIIRYADSDLQTQSEATLRIFKWNENLQKWEELCGFINTERNIVGANINSLGIYAAFTTGYLRGDANGDTKINLVDVIYLANYVLKGGPSPVPLVSGDVNCDGKYDLVDVIKLARYVLFGEPFPC